MNLVIQCILSRQVMKCLIVHCCIYINCYLSKVTKMSLLVISDFLTVLFFTAFFIRDLESILSVSCRLRSNLQQQEIKGYKICYYTSGFPSCCQVLKGKFFITDSYSVLCIERLWPVHVTISRVEIFAYSANFAAV